MQAASAEVAHSTSVRKKRKRKKKQARGDDTVQTITDTFRVHDSVDSTAGNAVGIEIAVDAEVGHETEDLRRKAPRSKSVLRIESPPHDYAQMEGENATVLGQDAPGTWQNGTRRFSATATDAAKILAWVVENTSRQNSVVATDDLLLDGFHNWNAVHSGNHDGERQLQHTFVIARAQRRRALKAIPGFADIVTAAKKAIESMQLHDTPEKLEWLTGHILNQGDVNARFHWHQDTNEERKEEGGRRDRRVKYTVIVKLNRGGCTSMQVCGQPEVFYHERGGSGIVFRSDLHHRTEKAEPGVWKLALFFGIFL
jgi:hypothetical protein